MMVVISFGLASKNPGIVKTSASDQEGKFSNLRPQVQRIVDDEDLTKARMLKKNTPSRKVSSINRSAWRPAAHVQPVPPTSPHALGLSGTYAIPGDFPDIASAVAVLNFVGTTGAVTFSVSAGSYTVLAGVTFTARSLSANPGDNSTVTVQPAAGAAVTINFQPNATEGKGFAFDGASHIVIDGSNAGSSLTLKYSGGTFPSGDAFAATIYVTGGSEDITVADCNIEGEIQTAGTFYDQTAGRPAVFCYQDSGAANANITVTGCTITNATFGIKVLSDYTVGYFQGPINYTYNNVGKAYGEYISHGAIIDLVDGMHYDHNNIDGVEFVPEYWNNGTTEYDGVASFADPSFLYDFGQPSAGHMYQCPLSTMNYNYVNDSHQNYDDSGFTFIIYGLLNRISGSTTVVQNNRIQGVHTTDTDGTDVGLRSESSAWHNSIRLTGVQGASQTSYCLRAVTGSIYNNALSNERTGAAGSLIRVLQGTPVGNSDGNAFYSTSGRITSASTLAAYFATGKDANSQFGPVGFSADLHLTSFPSSAENIGRPLILLTNDVDGDPRDTTVTGKRDAGADEVVANSGMPTASDVLPVSIAPPIAAFEPFGLPIAMKVTIKNNSTTATGAFNLRLQVSDASAYDNTVSVSLAGLESKLISFPNWNPSAPNPSPGWTLTATTSLGGDSRPGNDTLSRSQRVIVPDIFPGSLTFWTGASTGGWTGAGDFVFSNSFTKLGGPYAGYSWVTRTTGTYTNATANTVTSPWLDLSLMGGDGNVYISFYQSLQTEPSWDRSWMQYTTDGTTWKNLGVLNDPNGVNWYSTGVYQNAAGPCWDSVLAFELGLIPSPFLFSPGWTSNGDCAGADVPTGPDGYIFTQLKITPANYLDIVGAMAVRFRFVGYADAGANFDGWAIDNLRIGGTGPTGTPADFSGKVYDDADGSGTDNSMAPGAGLLGNGARMTFDAGVAGVVIQMKYFGVLIGSDTTDGSGNYNFVTGLNAPGTYTFEVVTGLGVSDPAAGKYSVNYTNNGINQTGKNFGLYDGSVSGTKFDDINNNGVNDDGAGFAGFTIEVHKDSCNGALYTSKVTGAGGTYAIPLPPGTWYVKEVLQPGNRQTYPVGNCHIVNISGPSGGGSAHQTGVDFGNFTLNTIKVQLFIDQNGNGVKEVADVNALPGSLYEVYELSKNGVVLFSDTLGRNVVTEFTHFGLDTGTYVSTQIVGTPAGWVRTAGSNVMNVSVVSSGATHNVLRMDYKLLNVSGVKFNDLNGNGVNDSEPGLAGWTINLTGNGGGNDTTDAGGNYSFVNVGPGTHTLSEVAQTGWVATVPAGGTTNFTNNSGVDKTQDFGNFDQVCLSGTKYRDRNNNGQQDAGEESLAGWKINYGALSATTNANGEYSFCDLGPGSDTLSEVGQLGYTQTEPAGGFYVVTRSSGLDVTGLNFGNFDQNDSAKYRTWTVDELSNATEAKPVKRPKPGKPVLAPPNSGNLLEDMLKFQAGTLKVGLSGQLNEGGKEKAYLQPAKQKDAYTTWNSKEVKHTGAGRGFDLDVKGKQLLKRKKSLPATKKNSCTIAELLALKLNLLASEKGKTPAGLGDLLIDDGGRWQDSTIYQFAADMDNKMTNWEGISFDVYAEACALAASINTAFSTGSTSDTTNNGGWFSSPYKLKWAATKSLIDVPTLKQGKASPRPPVEEGTPKPLPTVFTLHQNYPNPFNPTTYISFDLPEEAVVTLKVYNILGQEIAKLLENEELSAGTEEVEFDASSLSSGVYLYRITAISVNEDGNIITTNAFTAVKKLLLLK